MKEIFEQIYLENKWKDKNGTASGPGSSIECSKSYLEFLQNFVSFNSIKSILDLGCGDFNLMKHFDFNNIEYLGVDLVSSAINSNIKNYSSLNIRFEENDITSYKSKNVYDLVIIKDVLQHLSNDNIIKFINNIDYSKKIIIVNDFTDVNIDSVNGGYRPINVNIDPFNFNCEKIFEFNSCGFIKYVNLIGNL
jgi:2-polyprenyl-3-methyl-5-hydroxy-6-metoxy-1,4-benzoquinol methylase